MNKLAFRTKVRGVGCGIMRIGPGPCRAFCKSRGFLCEALSLQHTHMTLQRAMPVQMLFLSAAMKHVCAARLQGPAAEAAESEENHE